MKNIRFEKISNSSMFLMIFQIWKRNYLQFKRSWLVSLFWILIEPLFTLGALGFGLGSYISTIQGVPYAEFFFPGLISMSAMFVSFFSSTYEGFSKLTYQKVFATQMMTAIEPREILLGEILWSATKGTLSAIGISIIATGFGLVDTMRIVPMLFFIFISSMVFASFGMLVTTLVRNYDQIIYPSSGIIVPLSLFSGTYFPIDELPFGLKYIAYISPLTHTVRACRKLLLVGFDWWLLLNFGYLALIIFILVKFANANLEKKLLN